MRKSFCHSLFSFSFPLVSVDVANVIRPDLHNITNRDFVSILLYIVGHPLCCDVLFLRWSSGYLWAAQKLQYQPTRRRNITCQKCLAKSHHWGGDTDCTVRVDSLAHRKWKEIKQQPGTAGPGNMLGCCLISFHFLWGKLSTRTVECCAVAAELPISLQDITRLSLSPACLHQLNCRPLRMRWDEFCSGWSSGLILLLYDMHRINARVLVALKTRIVPPKIVLSIEMEEMHQIFPNVPN